MITLSNVKTQGGESEPQSVRFTPDAIPEAKSSKTGASVRYVESPNKNWYIFRASYGREEQASDYIIEDGTYTYIAKYYVERFVKGKRKRVLKSLIPNLLFVYTTEDKAEQYVKHSPALSYLSYYYNHFEVDEHAKNPPLTIGSEEMNQFIRVTYSKNKHLLFFTPSQFHYKVGEYVKVVDGPFAGVEGKVARISGQQRVVVTLSKIGLISTAYIPTAFIRPIKTDKLI